ncbi:MAG TPA: hypothetical protein DCR04_13740 [Flavobacteriales bacterium]|nr:hypothetical protein [Flavobacteriales bacterium]
MKNLMMLMVAVLVSSFSFAQTVKYDNGSVKSEYKQVGELVAVTHYYQSGTVKETGFFKDEIPEGKWETFAENGTKTAELNYKDGKRNGEFRVWDEFTQAYMEISYANGEMIKANKWIKAEDFASINK